VYRADGCPHCGGEPFHRLGCPFVRNALIFTTIGFGAIVGVFMAVNGTDSPGPVMLFVLYLVLLVVWMVASRLRRDRRS
jgi:peptidoglycan/LPS O-acetylase OafA/YrhL